MGLMVDSQILLISLLADNRSIGGGVKSGRAARKGCREFREGFHLYLGRREKEGD